MHMCGDYFMMLAVSITCLTACNNSESSHIHGPLIRNHCNTFLHQPILVAWTHTVYTLNTFKIVSKTIVHSLCVANSNLYITQMRGNVN